MLQRLFTACVLVTFLGGAAGDVAAQMMGSGMSAFGGGMGGNSFSSGGFGSSGFGASGFGNAGFGSTRFGGSGMGGGFGTSGFGNAGFGSTRFGSSGMGGFGSGQMLGNQGMGMSGGYGGQNFVGRDSGDVQAMTQMGQAGTQFFNQMNRNLQRRERDAAPVVASSPQPVRVDLHVAFDAPQPAPSAVEMRLRARLEKVLAQHNIGQPIVTMEGDTAVLSGIAASESERLVLEKLVALEPGVRQVRNEMIVATPSI